MGIRLHASIENNLVQKHKHLINERQALSINAFSLKEYGGEFMTIFFPYKLAFLRKTRTKALTNFPDDVPEKYFTDFDEILYEKYERNILIDNNVIGKIIEVGNVEEVKTKENLNNSSNLQLILCDTKYGFTLKYTLWGEHAKQIFAHTTKKIDAVVVCVMRFLSVKSYKFSMRTSSVFGALFGKSKKYEVQVKTPRSAYIARSGFYMMFVVSQNIPSEDI
ncbi:hypothetical protein N665_0355s0015 [Sinapis alba]|nr:hypothetical protein N665_0355s0015 [Sinapis alba]